MAKINCFSGLIGRKKEPRAIDFNAALKTLKIRIEHLVKPLEGDEMRAGSYDIPAPSNIEKDSIHVKVTKHESPFAEEAQEVAYEGGDEHEEKASMKRDLSDYDLQALEDESTAQGPKRCYSNSFENGTSTQFQDGKSDDDQLGLDTINSGHVSDPGIGKAEFWGSPKLKRSCSNLGQQNDHLPRSKSQYLGELPQHPITHGVPGSPVLSVVSHGSADRVMLKKHSSSQILPSRSRKLWWKLFLWSHRNLQNWTIKSQPQAVTTILNQQGGYSSDTLEPNRAITLSKAKSPCSLTRDSFNKEHNEDDDSRSLCGSRGEGSCHWEPNQWVAFPVEASPLARVNEWVKDLDTQLPPLDDHDGNNGQGIAFSLSPENGISPARSIVHMTRVQTHLSEEILHANSVIQSLNSSSTVAHISSISLKAIPYLSAFCSLRSVNLSNNLIGNISSGSLPKGLHTLDLSRNKISTIEGLRELTRLRVLDLSYNRISRIGQGLSNCTTIKELYLAGNKISDVEGLHRLLKLTVLDLSFNKITTTKALGQLVANYNSLQALNLLGNPIQNNISDDQLRKAVCSLLPKLVYLNKQAIKPQRAREVLTDSIAKAALGTSNSWNSRRKSSKRVTTGGSTSIVSHRSRVGGEQKLKSQSKSIARHQLKRVESARGSSYH